MLINRRGFLASSAVMVGGATFPQAVGAPIVETRSGRLQGRSRDGVNAFLGIPYGRSTAQTMRFRPPAPPQAWRGVRQATAPGNRAAQTPDVRPPRSGTAPSYSIWSSFPGTEPESEDCLFLNVWAPAGAGSSRPVMVWLHGGGFASGEGAQPPSMGDTLARLGDVVVVSINHRLSALGYLYLGGLGSQYAGWSNQGQLDQIAALEWVRDNIAAFGGDPANVTIFGQSGGGAKVCTLMAMPAAHGLFAKAICQSGAYLASTRVETAERATHAVFTELGITPGRVDQLQAVPAPRLLGAAAQVSAKGLAAGFEPVLDGVQIPFDPFSQGALRLSRDVPLLIGSVHDEAPAVLQDATAFDLDWEELPDRWSHWASRWREVPAMPRPEAAAQIAEFRAAFPEARASELFFRMVSDLHLILNAVTIAGRKTASGGAPAYLYEVDYRTPVDGGRWGSPHSLDVPLVFGKVDAAPSIVPNDPAAISTSATMIRAWSAFAHRGVPAAPSLPVWPAFEPCTAKAMMLSEESHLVEGYRADDRRILDGVPTSHA